MQVFPRRTHTFTFVFFLDFQTPKTPFPLIIWNYLQFTEQLIIPCLCSCAHYTLWSKEPLLAPVAALPLCPYLRHSHRTFCATLWLWRGWSAILPDCKLLGIFNSLLSPAPNTVSYLVSFQQIFLELMEKRKKERSHWWTCSCSWLHVFVPVFLFFSCLSLTF